MRHSDSDSPIQHSAVQSTDRRKRSRCTVLKMSNNYRLPSFVSLPEKSSLPELVQCVKDWAIANGVAMRWRKHFSEDSVVFAPFTLLPSPFPKSEFEKAVEIQSSLNTLIHNVAHDHEFLKITLETTILVDDFTRRLFDVYETVRKEGFAQNYSVGLFRSDYMLDVDKEKLSIKQVEMNTISVSLAGLAGQINSLHRFVLERISRFDDIHHLPENKSLEGFCAGLVEAWKLYGDTNAAILVVVEKFLLNICDQRSIEFGIYKLEPKITIIRRTFAELADRGRLNQDKKYSIDGKEIAVVYYRTGYSPNEYDGDRDWQVRLDIERSKALKCPSIQYHLAGTKKVQQVLASENALARFLSDKNTIETVYTVFTGLYSLDLNPVGDNAAEMAMKKPEHFVLKPQREGGGHNIYDDDIVKVLSKIKQSKERTAYILMDRIRPPVNSAYLIRADADENLTPQDVVSELGIYGVVIGSMNEIVMNTTLGHLLRTKSNLANEGGVAAGSGALDSPYLY